MWHIMTHLAEQRARALGDGVGLADAHLALEQPLAKEVGPVAAQEDGVRCERQLERVVVVAVKGTNS